MIGIYKIINPQGKIYIGQSVNIPLRFEQHRKSILSEINNTSKLYKSLIEFGVAKHNFEIQEICLKESLNQRERFWQMHFDSIENGLNGVLVSERAIYKNSENDSLIAKQIHLDEKVIETLTIKAVKERTTFKELAQKILTKVAKDYDRNL